MKKTGEILRKAREAKGLSLNEVALSLKISSKILKAIEDDNEDQLPAKTFLRGFVQSYATFLRLDADSIMATFYEEMGSTKPKALVRTHNPNDNFSPISGSPDEIDAERIAQENAAAGSSEKISTKKSTRTSKPYDPLAPINQTSNTKTVVIAVIGAVLIGLILFTKKMIDKYSKEARVDSVEVSQPIEIPPADANPPPPVDLPNEKPTNTPVSSAKTENPTNNMSVATPITPAKPSIPISVPSPAPVAAISPTPTLSPTPKPSQSPTPSPSPTPTPKASPSPVTAAVPASTPAAVASPSPSPAADAEKEKVAKPVELIIEALDNVDIEYSSNVGKKSVIKLSSEQVHTFKSKNGLKLNISNGGAVNLILNGRDLGIPGDLGKPIKLSY